MSQLLCTGGTGDKKMAESKGSLIAKSVSKHAGRAKEKILQNLGKVDRTADEIFDEHLQNFTKQQNNANRLQKEFNNYIRCVRAVQAASKSLMDSLNEMYESSWLGHELLYTQSQNIEMLWNDFTHKLADQVLIPLNTYQAQFPETRKKIEKRGRKLVDYDSQRHNVQSLQASTNSAKKKDEAKLAKVKEQLEEAKRTYELLNSELHDELPALYDSRVLFLVTNLQTYFAAEQNFHVETSKVFAELEAIVDRLATDSQRTSYSIKKLHSPKPILNHNHNAKLTSPTSSHASSINDEIPSTSEADVLSSTITPDEDKENGSEYGDSRNSIDESVNNEELNATKTSEEKNVIAQSSSSDSGGTISASSVTVTKSTENGGNNAILTSVAISSSISSSSNSSSNASNNVTANKTSSDGNKTNVTANGVVHSNEKNNKYQVEQLYDIPEGATTDNLPPGVLYKVKATYKYKQEDVDELSFDVGEIIRVIEYEDPEEKEEGWLMGVKESTGEKGMFPANFTKPL